MASTATVCDTDTKLWLHCDGTDTSQTFTDSSESGHTVEAIGTAQIDTAQKVFGTASGLFDSNSDYLKIASNADFSFGTGDFTIDFRIRFSSVAASSGIFARCDATLDNGWIFLYSASYSGYSIYLGSTVTHTWTTTPSLNTWYHIALERISGVWELFIDGESQGTHSDSTNKDYADYVYIGLGSSKSDSYLAGWLDEFRVVKGTAVWTSNFTPPAAAYTLPTSIKKVSGVAYASIKKISGVAIASIEKVSGVT